MRTNRGPIGVGANTFRPNTGTLPRTQQRSSVPAGHADLGPRFAQLPKKETLRGGSDILAGFDHLNAVIWLNAASLKKLDMARINGKVLNLRDIKTLSHEFAHVWQNRDVLGDFADLAPGGEALGKETKERLSRVRGEKAAALVRKDTERISKMTEADYIDFRLKRERQAELVALTIAAELENSKALAGFAEQDADTWLHNNRTSYVEGPNGIRAHYRKVRDKLEKATTKAKESASGRPDEAVSKVTEEALDKPKSRQVMRLVSSYTDVFPGKEESISLHKLLKLMDRYDALIVVSMPIANP